MLIFSSTFWLASRKQALATAKRGVLFQDTQELIFHCQEHHWLTFKNRAREETHFCCVICSADDVLCNSIMAILLFSVLFWFFAVLSENLNTVRRSDFKLMNQHLVPMVITLTEYIYEGMY
uniref:Uncharacterized protein n=1 Tax=Sphaerodactylus townsendi TaxID=933632 RepID=A0ACB8E8P1_9SAUR